MENLNYGLNLTAMGFSHKNKIHDTFLDQVQELLKIQIQLNFIVKYQFIQVHLNKLKLMETAKILRFL